MDAKFIIFVLSIVFLNVTISAGVLLAGTMGISVILDSFISYGNLCCHQYIQTHTHNARVRDIGRCCLVGVGRGPLWSANESPLAT